MSCDRDKPSNPKTKRTVLIYAVASNNLSSYLVDDKNEMIKVAPGVAGLGSDVRVLLYSVASQSATEATLSELTKDAFGTWDFSIIKSYDRNTFSTDPERMSQVFDDIRSISPSEKFGLIFWSHGTGWIPNFTEHEVPTPEGLKKSYGMDKYQGVTDYCDIDELAQAIPDRMFDYIWFDLCYMMGVEVVYQLRNKCDYIAGYPTEDWSMGMNYDDTLPMLVAPNPDLAGAAASFFDYYNNQNMAVTVTVVSTDGLDKVADAAAEIYAYGSRPLSTDGLQNYSRLRTGLYDFGQFTKGYLDRTDSKAAILSDSLDSALKNVTVYAGCSTKDFNNRADAFNPAIYSGLSCHFPGYSSYKTEQYYETLDWPQTTHP